MSSNSVQVKSLKSLIEPFLKPGLAVILPTDALPFPHRKQKGLAVPNSHLTLPTSHLRLAQLSSSGLCCPSLQV